MPVATERHEFQAEVNQLLDLLIHSLYSHKDIFLRELISNASDALDRLRFDGLTDPSLLPPDELHIRIERDAEARMLSVSDNGIGMSHDELVENLGTIAHSGTTQFIQAMRAAKDEELSVDLIGQFGVGFYSSFIVADRVTVVSRRAGEEQAHAWESEGQGAFTVQPAEREHAGTTVTLHLRPADEENGLQDYAEGWVIQEIVKRYSDFVAYPIKMEMPKVAQEGEAAAETAEVEERTLNSMKAIWTRSKADVPEEEYKEFYKHITHDWSEPLRHIAVQLEGAVDARALLYIPSHAPFDLYHREMSYRGLQLYIKRVFIMDECRDLMPVHLRFIKGVVDSDDLTLNVSREMLQQDRAIVTIRKFLAKKVTDELRRMLREDRAAYREFWQQFGPVVKEGLLSGGEKPEQILSLVLSHSTRDATELTTLDDYVARMPGDQQSLYYLTGPSVASARQSPHLEAFLERGHEVLLFTDRVDEVWLQNPPPFQGKSWQSVGRGAVDLGTEEERKQAKAELEERAKGFEDLTKLLQELLDEEVKEVRVTNRLTSSPACLVGETYDLSPQIVEILREAGQDVPKVKRILEINPSHPVIEKLQQRYELDRRDPVVREYAELIYAQALLAEGGTPRDPAAFSKRLAELMERGL